MHTGTFLILIGMPPPFENVAVIVVIVTLVLVASYTYNIILVCKNNTICMFIHLPSHY